MAANRKYIFVLVPLVVASCYFVILSQKQGGYMKYLIAVRNGINGYMWEVKNSSQNYTSYQVRHTIILILLFMLY